jgi:citrate synthase
VPKKLPPIKSDIAWSDRERIVIRGHDLADDLLGKATFGNIAFLELFHRLPEPREATVFDSLLVSLVEHGVTANALATRLTLLGAPESLQGAVAAGLLGLGSTFVGTIEGSARMLQEAPSGRPWRTDDAELEKVAEDIVDSFLSQKAPIPGIGHAVHRPVDPRAERLFEIARENGLDDANERLLRRVGKIAEQRLDRELPVNATGAIGAIASTLGLSWKVARGLGVMARAVGLVGHIQEELGQPIAASVWYGTEEAASIHFDHLKAR